MMDTVMSKYIEIQNYLKCGMVEGNIGEEQFDSGHPLFEGKW